MPNPNPNPHPHPNPHPNPNPNLERSGWANLTFKLGETMVLPSERLLELHLPKDGSIKSVADKKLFISNWAHEYVAMRRNPKAYHKLTDGTWDADILHDMMFSFWVLKPVPDTHPQKKALETVGIFFECNCPQFNHYYVCKHCLAMGLTKGLAKVPDRFTMVTVAKRKAPAGASLSKRSKCMVID